MARFFGVNWGVAVLWLAVASSSVGTYLYWHGKVFGWHGAQATAAEELHVRGIKAEHYSTTNYGDSVRVLFSKSEPGHFVDVDVERDRNGKWAVTSLNKDFVP